MYAVVSLHTPNFQPLADYTWPNKIEYAERHGYKHYCKTDGFTTHPSGEKIPLIKQYLTDNPDVEWVMWIDTDTLITNFNTKIEDLIDDQYHFIIATDGNGINAGCFLMRNSPECHAYLDWTLSVYPEFEATHKFFAEQATMDASLNMPEWSPLIKLIPQYLVNSHDCWPNQWKPEPTWLDKFNNRSWWEPGDFLVHWPGSTLETRLTRQIPYYIPKVIK